MNIVNAIAFIAERKIEAALAEGEFDNLPGMGKPLEIEDTSHLPPDMRMAYTILKNSGYLDKDPGKNNTVSMRELLSSAKDEQICYTRMQKLKVVLARVEQAREEAGHTKGGGETGNEDSPYLEKLLARV